LGRVSKAWSIQFSRPIRRDGQFVGVLVVSVSPFYLSKTMEALGLGPNDSTGLFLADGTYLARSSHINDFLGKQVKASRKFLADPAETGHFRDLSSFDHTWRTFSWHRLAKFPLLVVVGLAEPDALDGVEKAIRSSRQANFVGSILVLGFMAAIAMLLLQVERQKRRLASNEALYRSLFEKNASVKLIIDSTSGQIVEANQAACDFYGYSRSVLQRMNIADINCLPQVAVEMEATKAAKEVRSHFFFPHRLANGEIRQVEVYSGPLELNGRPLLYSIIHDVTERSQLELRLKESEARYRNIFDVIPDGMMLINKDREIVLWNQAALSILGVSERGLKGREVKLNYRDGQAVPHDQYPSWRAISLPTSQGLYSIPQADGSKQWIAVSTRQLPTDAEGQTSGAVVSFSDITRLVDLEESLLISQSVFDAATEGIMVTDAENQIVRINPAFTRITGYEYADVQGKTPALLASGHHDQSFYQAMYQSLQDKGRWEGEIVNRRKDGKVFVEWLKISAVKDRDGMLLRYVALLSDITVKKKQEEDIWHRAHYDPLTELPNRTLFMDRLGQAMAHAVRREEAVGVLFIDLDKFKPVNDTYGHQAGDELLRQVARRITNCLREEDTVARLGGDEFVAMLPAILNVTDCVKVADKILDNLNQPFRIGELIVEISASIGVSLSKNGISAEALVKQADQAMYRAKADGRHTVRQF
jgi:diguanylate cyclase (GGDEF)-like protein/PAS domain S-box-containing protein